MIRDGVGTVLRLENWLASTLGEQLKGPWLSPTVLLNESSVDVSIDYYSFDTTVSIFNVRTSHHPTFLSVSR